MDDDELRNGKNFFFKLGTKTIPGIVTKILYAIDVNTGEQKTVDVLSKNEIAVCKISLADKIVVDEFKKHKTLGEFILIDRITYMTSACGVVEKVDTKEAGLYEGRVDRSVRAAIKSQTAITVEFIDGVKGINRAFVEDVEKALNLGGRHTYLYAPSDGEDIALVLKHLHRAGIVVLLLVDVKQAASLNVQDDTYISGWLSDFANVDDVAGFIRKQSAIGDSVVRSRDFI